MLKISSYSLHGIKLRRLRFWSPLCALLAIVLCFEAKAKPTENRNKNIDFEDDLVEGLNKQPLDSLSEVLERQKSKKKHLYRKKKNFKEENKQTLREMRYFE